MRIRVDSFSGVGAILVAARVSLAACDSNDGSPNENGDGDGDFGGSTGDGDGDGDSGGSSGDGDGDGDGDSGGSSGDGDGDGDSGGSSGDGDGDGDGDSSGDGGEPSGGGGTASGTGGSDGSGGTEATGGTGGQTDPGLDCPLKEYVPPTCSDDDACSEGWGCLRGVCVELCDESVDDLDTGLDEGVQPWAHICNIRRYGPMTYVFDDNGCQRAYHYSLRIFRLTAETELGWNLERTEIDPSRPQDPERIGSGQFVLEGGVDSWIALLWYAVSPDGSFVAFRTGSAGTTTVGRIFIDSGELTLSPTFSSGTGLGSAFLSDDLLAVSFDADPGAGIDDEWGVLSFASGEVTSLLTSASGLSTNGLIALPEKGALLAGTNTGTVYAVAWSEVTAAAVAGSSINLTPSDTVLALSSPGDILPLDDAHIYYSDFGSETLLRPVGDFGPTMLDAPTQVLTLSGDETTSDAFWGGLSPVTSDLAVTQLFLSALVVEIP